MLSLLYDPDRSVIQNRMVYDSTRCQIRVSFNAMLVPKQMIGIGGAFGSVGLLGRTVHLDGISVYSMDVAPIVDKSTGLRREGGGKIIEHRIEKLLVNGAALQPPYFNAFVMGSGGGQGALVGAALDQPQELSRTLQDDGDFLQSWTSKDPTSRS
eukprot:scaffold15_cov194-Alexandrium_tamarense.AAC.16